MLSWWPIENTRTTHGQDTTRTGQRHRHRRTDTESTKSGSREFNLEAIILIDPTQDLTFCY